MSYKRLTERVGKGVAIKETSTNDNKSIWNAIECLADLEDKIENGTLIEIPIPYRTELHFLYSREHYGKPLPPCIYSSKEWIFNVRYDGKSWFSVAGRGIGYFGEYLHEIGKTVFLTKAEAEAKLKEQQNER